MFFTTTRPLLRSALLLLSGASLFLGASLLNSAEASDGTIDSASVAVTERVRFEAATPGTVSASTHQVFSLGANGVYFTGSPVRDPVTSLPLDQVTPPPSSAIRKFNADGSLAWMRLRKTHIVSEDPEVRSAFERHSPDEEFQSIPVEDAEHADHVTHVMATADGGVVVASDLYQQVYSTFEGPNGSTGRREYPERTTRTLYRKFDAEGNLLWRQMTVTDTDLTHGPTTLRIVALPDGSLATALTTVPFHGSGAQNQTFNRQTIVRILDQTDGDLLRQKIFGGDAPMEYRDCFSKTMEIDAQGRLYVLSREQETAFTPDTALTRNIVRRIDPATLEATWVEARESGTDPATLEYWTLLAVDGEGAIHVAGSHHRYGAEYADYRERAFAQKYTANLAFQWRGEGPLPGQIGVYKGGVEPTGLHVSAQGVTLVGMTHAVANDGYYKLTRTETMRFSPEGALAWHRYLDTEAGDGFYGKGFYTDFSEVDADGNVYLACRHTTTQWTHANFVKYASDGLLQFIRVLDANHLYSDFTLAANGHPTALSALVDPPGTAVILEVQNPALVLAPPIAVTITKPLEGGRVPHPAMINLVATVTKARADVSLEEVAFYVDGVWVGAKVAGPFDITVDNPGLGSHTLVVKGRVRNMGEFASAPVSFIVGNGVPPPVTANLTVSLAGPADSGSVTAGFLGETVRVEGRTYQVKATAKPGFLFSHWSGGSPSTERTLQFVMTPGLALTANFVVNPFLLTQGTYAGLGELTAGGGGTAVGRVAFSATVNRKGAVSFKIKLGKIAIPLKGRLALDGSFTGQFTFQGKTVGVGLQLDVTNGTNRIAGTVTVDGVSYAVDGDRAIYSDRNPVEEPGLYTFVLSGLAGPGVPAGTSYFTAQITPAGTTLITGSMADGTPIASAAKLGADGSIAIYASLNGGMGILAGDLKFQAVADPAVSDVIGELLWEKRLDPQTIAFSARGAVLGSAYSQPGLRFPALGETPFGSPGQVRVQFATSPAIADVLADLNAQGKATNPAAPGFTLQVKHSTGRFSGKLGASQTVAKFAGVILRKQQRAEGFVTGAAVGTVTFAPAP